MNEEWMAEEGLMQVLDLESASAWVDRSAMDD